MFNKCFCISLLQYLINLLSIVVDVSFLCVFVLVFGQATRKIIMAFVWKWLVIKWERMFKYMKWRGVLEIMWESIVAVIIHSSRYFLSERSSPKTLNVVIAMKNFRLAQNKKKSNPVLYLNVLKQISFHVASFHVISN